MGTNFYLQRKNAPKMDRFVTSTPLHIGKSSSGWAFSLNVTEVKSLEEWQALWADPELEIVDEYGEVLHPNDMLAWITQRGKQKPLSMENCGIGNYSSVQDFLDKNYAVEGVNNLLFPKIDGNRCIKHEGTYALIVGSFS